MNSNSKPLEKKAQYQQIVIQNISQSSDLQQTLKKNHNFSIQTPQKEFRPFGDATNLTEQKSFKTVLNKAVSRQMQRELSQTDAKVCQQPISQISIYSVAKPKIKQIAKINMHQGKKLKDNSDEDELIDSMEMSSDLQSMQGSEKNKNSQQQKMFSFSESQKSLGGSHYTQTIQPRAKPLQANTITCESINNLNSGTSSASKRAKWDFTGVSSAFQNSCAQQIDSGIKSLKQIKNVDKQSKIQELHQQYLAIKQELLALKSNNSQSYKNKTKPKHKQTIPDIDDENIDFSYCSEEEKLQSPISIKSKQNQNIKRKSNHFRSLDVNVANFNKNREKSMKDNYVTLNSVKQELGVAKKNQNHTQYREKPSSMKSQLQLGMRKLSLNKQFCAQKTKLRKDSSKVSVRFQKKGQSGMSYFSSQSSLEYKDCLSGRSSGSSNYELARDKSLCSSCEKELMSVKISKYTSNNHQVLSTQKSAKKKQSGKTTTKNTKNQSMNNKRKSTSESAYKQKDISDRRMSEIYMRSPNFINSLAQSPWMNQNLIQHQYQPQIDFSTMNSYWSRLQQFNHQKQLLYHNPQQSYQGFIPNTNYVNQQQQPSLCTNFKNQRSSMSISNATTPQMMTSSDPKSQLEAIEVLIQQAKEKINNNLNQQDQQKLEKYQQMLEDLKQQSRSSRNSGSQLKNTQDSSGLQNQQKFIFQSQNTQYSAAFSDENQLFPLSNNKQPSNYNQLEQRRYSESNSPLRKINAFNQKKISSEVLQKLEYDNKQENSCNIFNQSISSISGNPANNREQSVINEKLHQEKKDLNNPEMQKNHQINKIEAKGQDPQINKSNLIWIDMNDTSNKISNKNSTFNNKRSSAQNLSQAKKDFQNCKKQKLPQSIPEEKEEEQISPSKDGSKINNKTVQQSNYYSQNSAQQNPSVVVINIQETKKYCKNPSQDNSKNGAWVMDFSQSNTQNLELNKDGSAKKVKLQSLQERLSKKHHESTQKEKINKEFTKEELFNLKKEILKSARKNAAQLNTQQVLSKQEPLDSKPLAKQLNQTDSNPIVLMQRLSQGLKPSISKKDMLKLTSKNYENLPEIKKKKFEESKREDQMKRLAAVKELEKKRRQTIANKKTTQLTKKKLE